MAYRIQPAINAGHTVPVYYIGARRRNGEVEAYEKLLGYTTEDGLYPGREIEIIATKRGDGSASNPYAGKAQKGSDGWQVIIAE